MQNKNSKIYQSKTNKKEIEIARGKAPNGLDCIVYEVETTKTYLDNNGHEAERVTKQIRTVDISSGRDMVMDYDKKDQILAMLA